MHIAILLVRMLSEQFQIRLLPVLWSTRAGSDVMKRIVAPMVGGLITAFILQMIIYPAIFLLWKRKELNLKEGL